MATLVQADRGEPCRLPNLARRTSGPELSATPWSSAKHRWSSYVAERSRWAASRVRSGRVKGTRRTPARLFGSTGPAWSSQLCSTRITPASKSTSLARSPRISPRRRAPSPRPPGQPARAPPTGVPPPPAGQLDRERPSAPVARARAWGWSSRRLEPRPACRSPAGAGSSCGSSTGSCPRRPSRRRGLERLLGSPRRGACGRTQERRELEASAHSCEAQTVCMEFPSES